jgi:hypothetical protein
MFRVLFLALIALTAVNAFAPAGRVQHSSKLSMMDAKKALGVAALGFALAGPAVPQRAMADGSVSKSTVYRARNNYGAKIMNLEQAVASGDLSVFDKKASNWFDLFISGANALPGPVNKENKAKETALKGDIYAAVSAKDVGKAKAAYAEFIKVADLKSNYKPGELGQTDSSGYAPTWGTDRQYIYQR